MDGRGSPVKGEKTGTRISFGAYARSKPLEIQRCGECGVGWGVGWVGGWGHHSQPFIKQIAMIALPSRIATGTQASHLS